ncbi:bifunctional aminoglycoside phosphotransferase/ATP-binding protein [Actimicrobium antarcticum]|uniref:Bifunctional aminoglycoside phosphotransferase/ATP-binding protein n=1 Tax=Actimicrobium antarcticum TaxID=1051899 RepID=A0ABP7SKC7_9BURK
MQRLAAVLGKDGQTVDVMQTPISWVLVTALWAYKIRKAVQFDFVDFSTLAARCHDCHEELRLNRRLAAALYLDVVAITGSADQPSLDGAGEAIEYAVRMHAFSQQSLWSSRLALHRLTTADIDQLAILMAHFHQAAAVAGGSSSAGTPASIRQTAEETLALIDSRITGSVQRQQLARITDWQILQHQQLDALFTLRKTQGQVRECHGDLHSGNILTEHGEVIPFDCLEFAVQLRWIDVLSEMAFISMDLQCHARPDLANRLLNQYLEITGDYEGVPVLRYYEVQRALVRCKVALLRNDQHVSDAGPAMTPAQQARDYLAFSAEHCVAPPGAILITHGYSGSGKSTVSGCVATIVGAIRIRSDVERKRLHGITAGAGAGAVAAAAPDGGIYAQAGTTLTYQRLGVLARGVLAAGLPVVIDAAFLKRDQRGLFERLARELGVPFLILDCQASDATLRTRLAARSQDVSDADVTVLVNQMAHADALSPDELKTTIVFDSGLVATTQALMEFIAPVLRRLNIRTNPVPPAAAGAFQGGGVMDRPT